MQLAVNCAKARNSTIVTDLKMEANCAFRIRRDGIKGYRHNQGLLRVTTR